MALTRYRSGITVLTENIANSWYGGLHGTSQGDELATDNPLVAGHVHDGSHEDGHAQKINLENHVTGELDGDNIQDASIPENKLVSTYRQIFDDEVARLADNTDYDNTDLYRKALQLDTLTEYVLTDVSPITWSALGSGGDGGTVAQPTFTLVMDNAFPLDSSDGVVTVTFPPAPTDILIKQLILSAITVDSGFDRSEFDVEREFTLISNVTIDGVLIEADGVASAQIFTEEAEVPVDLNIPLAIGEVLSFDISFISSTLPSVSVTYVEQSGTLPAKNYFIGTASGSAVITGPTVASTCTLTVNSDPTDGSAGITFSQTFFSPTTSVGLTPAGGARTSGNDDYDNTLGTPTLIAANIAAAINDSANSFDTFMTASAVGDTVTLTASPAGPIGNQISVDNEIPEITESDDHFTGGIMGSATSVILEPAPANGTITGIYVSHIFSSTDIGFYFYTVEELRINGGANQLDSQITCNLMHPPINGHNPLLDIPISAGDVITLRVNGYISSATIIGPMVIYQPD